MTVTVAHDDIDFTRQNFASDHPGIGRAGGPNPVWPLILTSLTWGLHVSKTPNGGAAIHGIKDFSLFGINEIRSLVAMGFRVTGFPGFAKVAEADLDNPVPDYLSNPHHYDPETGAAGAMKTWREWQPYVRIIDGWGYVELRESGDVLAQLATAGIPILSRDEVLAVIAAQEPVEP